MKQIRQGMNKQSKALRTINTRNRGIGLGDLFSLVTTFTGVGYAWKKWHIYRGTMCGCQARRRRLNQVRFMSPIAFAWEKDLCPGCKDYELAKPGDEVHPPIKPGPRFDYNKELF